MTQPPRIVHRCLRVVATVLSLGSLLVGCGSKTAEHSDSNSNWLEECEQTADCDGGYSCVGKVCLMDCGGDGACSGIANECVPVDDSRGCLDTGMGQGHCLAQCTEDIDCAALGAHVSCEGGFCLGQGMCSTDAGPPATPDGSASPVDLEPDASAGCPAVGATCPAGCSDIAARAIEPDAACHAPMASHLGCTASETKTDDEVCVATRDGATLYTMSGTFTAVLIGSGEYRECTEREWAVVQGDLEDCVVTSDPVPPAASDASAGPVDVEPDASADAGGDDGLGASGGAPGSGGTDGAGGALGSGETDATEVTDRADAGPADDIAGFDDFILRSEVMHDYEGLTVSAYFDHNINAESLSDIRSTVVDGGAFELHWPQRWDRDTFGAYAFLFVDLDGDGFCTADDPAWRFFVNNDAFDDSEPQLYEFVPVAEDESPLAESVSCDEFDAGLGG